MMAAMGAFGSRGVAEARLVDSVVSVGDGSLTASSPTACNDASIPAIVMPGVTDNGMASAREGSPS